MYNYTSVNEFFELLQEEELSEEDRNNLEKHLKKNEMFFNKNHKDTKQADN